MPGPVGIDQGVGLAKCPAAAEHAHQLGHDDAGAHAAPGKL